MNSMNKSYTTELTPEVLDRLSMVANLNGEVGRKGRAVRNRSASVCPTPQVIMAQV